MRSARQGGERTDGNTADDYYWTTEIGAPVFELNGSGRIRWRDSRDGECEGT